MPEHKPSTLLDIAEFRHSNHQPVNVHVRGDFHEDPPVGLEAARRVAGLLTPDGGNVRETVDELEADDVALVTIGNVMSLTNDEHRRVENLMLHERKVGLAGIVVLAPRISKRVEVSCDVRIDARLGEIATIERLVTDPYNDWETMAIELDGLGDHADDWWDCPRCGAGTQTTPPGETPDRYCTDCDWSVTIPRPDDHGGDGDV